MDRQQLLDLLKFYEHTGYDEAVSETVQNRFNTSKGVPASAARVEKAEPAQTKPSELMTTTGTNTGSTLEEARALARDATSLDDLKAALAAFDGCELKHSARQMVFSDGNPQADIMLIGEAPGREEDKLGLPFVGRSGQLLDRMLAAIGLDRTGVYIGNCIYWRPPGNRTPTPAERALCEPFIRRQIELANPKIIMTLGGSSLAALFGLNGIMKLRGKRLEYEHEGLKIPAIPTLHPAALLRNPLNKRLSWQDLLALQMLREELGLIHAD
ncbi:MAG: uracil-DNA glycosylase [Pseudomonadota bacterium]